MAITGYAAGASVFSSMIASFMGGQSDKKRIEQQNALNLAAWQESVVALHDQMNIAWDRTQTELQEINRDKISTKMAVRTAAGKAKGTAQVKAAQIGVAGRRGFKTITSDISRTEAGAISEAQINSEIAVTNSINAFNDTAKAAVAQLNVSRPSMGTVPSVFGSVIGTLDTGLTSYNNLSKAQKADLGAIFSTDTPKSTSGVQLQIGD